MVLDIEKHIPEPVTKRKRGCVCVVMMLQRVLRKGGGRGLVPPTILFPVSSWDGCMSAQPCAGLMVGPASKTLFSHSFSFFLFFILFRSFIHFFGGSPFGEREKERGGRISSKHGALHAEVDSDVEVVE